MSYFIPQNVAVKKSKNMNNWTIGKKLIASFLAVAAITLLLGLVGYHGAVRSDEAITDIGRNRLPSVQSLLVKCAGQHDGAFQSS